MTQYQGPINRYDTARRPYYKDANGLRVPGVTSILSDGLPKAALINWAANSTAEYAVDHWDELTALSPSARLKKLQGARWEAKDAASARGVEVHLIADKLAQGEEVEVPDELTGYVEAYIQFLDEHNPESILTEFVTYSVKYGYVAIVDAAFKFPHLGETWIVDIKTNRSGIFGETALQLAGSRFAETYIDADGEHKPMFQVDGAGAIHIRPDGYSLVPVTAGPQQHRDLLYAREIKRFGEESRDLVGKPLTAPNRVTRRRLEIVEDRRVVGVPGCSDCRRDPADCTYHGVANVSNAYLKEPAS